MNTLNTQRGPRFALAHIHGGLHALRKALAARMPDDFEWWFTDGAGEVSAGWFVKSGQGRGGQEVRAPNVAALLVKWQAIDWTLQRRIFRQEIGAS